VFKIPISSIKLEPAGIGGKSEVGLEVPEPNPVPEAELYTPMLLTRLMDIAPTPSVDTGGALQVTLDALLALAEIVQSEKM